MRMLKIRLRRRAQTREELAARLHNCYLERVRERFVGYLALSAFFGIFLLLSLLIGLEHRRELALGRASVNWPTVPGVVTDVIGASARSRPKLEYRYEVGGETFFGRRVAFVRRHTFRPARGLEGYYGRGFDEGEPLTVYYSPDDPGVSVLLPGTPLSGTVIGYAVTGFLFVIGAGGFLLMLTRGLR